ncbi:hypothetical protein CBR_g19048 [Chara braunii]|uniref:Uncharacterized protein n=1 Tax=Chara braunii TaxID=69332 RepID=A0A388KX73_CHABU|nr:hypothetical protein CBR_g19048 [Chara braunii]|eukprot:GBG74641.1 hypothetical protein CBR_g19048 [Chara braunii]
MDQPAQMGARSPPAAPDADLTEERVRVLIAQCYEEGNIPEDIPCEGVEVVGREAVFKVNPEFDRVKVAWLKERTVVVVFRDAAKDLPRKVKADLIRAYENGWSRDGIFEEPIQRGTIRFEGPNVLAYVARNQTISAWLINRREDEVSIFGVSYSMSFRQWMTRLEWREFRRVELESMLWVMALQVPLDAVVYTKAAVRRVIGAITKEYPPIRDRSKPELMNLKYDVDPQFRDRMVDRIWVRTDNGDMRELRMVCSSTLWCKRCRGYFHEEEDCTKGLVGRQGDWRRTEENQRPFTTVASMNFYEDTHQRNAAGSSNPLPGNYEQGNQSRNRYNDSHLDVATRHDGILTAARRSFGELIPFRLVLEISTQRFYVDWQDRKIKYTVALIDAYVSPDILQGLTDNGLRLLPISLFLQNRDEPLGDIKIDQEIPASFLAGLNEKLPPNKKLDSIFVRNEEERDRKRDDTVEAIRSTDRAWKKGATWGREQEFTEGDQNTPRARLSIEK